MGVNEETREDVYEALNRAVLNGYVELREWTATRLAQDLIDYSEEFGEETIEELAVYCQSWLNGEP